MRRLAELERQLRREQTARRLEAAHIGAGGVTITGGAVKIRNAAGDLVVQIGLLPDGTYGVAAIDPATGHLVSLSTLAFGMRAVVNNEVLSITATDWADPDVGDPGPTITDLPVGTSGRCAVWLSATLRPGIPEEQVGSVEMSFAVSGASSRQAGTTGILGLGRGSSGTGNFDTTDGDLGNACLLEGLSPGLHTLHAQYQLTVNASTSFVIRPTLIAIPF
jgi:hypothetical protein